MAYTGTLKNVQEILRGICHYKKHFSLIRNQFFQTKIQGGSLEAESGIWFVILTSNSIFTFFIVLFGRIKEKSLKPMLTHRDNR